MELNICGYFDVKINIKLDLGDTKCENTLQRTLFIYLINKYISLSDICLTVDH